MKLLLFFFSLFLVFSVANAKSMCLGCVHTENGNDPKYQKLARDGVDLYNLQNGFNPPFYIKDVLKATRQLVSGMTYNVELLVVQSESCVHNKICTDQRGEIRKIQVNLWEHQWVKESPRTLSVRVIGNEKPVYDDYPN